MSSAIVRVKFRDFRHNYTTTINGSDEEIQEYFVNQWLNLGVVDDNMQQCISVDIIR